MLAESFDGSRKYLLFEGKLLSVEDIEKSKRVARSPKGTVFEDRLAVYTSNGNGTVTLLDSNYTVDFNKYLELDTEGEVEWYTEPSIDNCLYNLRNGVLTRYDVLHKDYSAIPLSVLPKLYGLEDTEPSDLYELSHTEYREVCIQNRLNDHGFTNIEGYWCIHNDSSYRVEIYDKSLDNNSKSITLSSKILKLILNVIQEKTN